MSKETKNKILIQVTRAFRGLFSSTYCTIHTLVLQVEEHYKHTCIIVYEHKINATAVADNSM